MRRKLTLSYVFNMSLGFTPAIIAILLCGVLPNHIAIYIGTGFGIVYTFLTMLQRANRAPNLILFISTAILGVLSIITLIPSHLIPDVPVHALPIVIESSILILMLIIYLQRNKLSEYFRNKKERLLCQSVESTIVSARVALALGTIHLVVILLALLFGKHPMKENTFQAIFLIMPWVIFIACIVFNQIGIAYFNNAVRRTVILPVVNKRGDVIGRSVAAEALKNKNKHINPVVRVAIVTNGMLFLCKRAQTRILDKGKMDVPLERYLRFGETLEECANDLVHSTFPDAKEVLKPVFSVSYHFENEITNRLTYLFILDVKDDIILCDPRFDGGKLWTLNQIDQNLGREYFGSCLEEEFEHLKVIIDIRERYKVS